MNPREKQPTDRAISWARLEEISWQAIHRKECGPACILIGIRDHETEGHHAPELVVDQALADLTRAMKLLAHSQDEAWARQALATCARILTDEEDNADVRADSLRVQ